MAALKELEFDDFVPLMEKFLEVRRGIMYVFCCNIVFINVRYL